MINVSDKFKNNLSSLGREIDAKIKYDNIVIDGSSVTSLQKTFDADFFKSAMQMVEIDLKGKYDLKDKIINAQFGVGHMNDTDEKEYISFGSFVITDCDYKVEKDTTSLVGYDFMIKSHFRYNINELNIEYPCTVKDLLKAIAVYMEIEWIESGLVNGDKLIDIDLYSNIDDVTYRNVLDEIAAVTCSTIMVIGDKLITKKVDVSQPEIVLDEDNLYTLDIKNEYGLVNIINLTREPTHDNYPYPVGWEDIPIDERVELIFSNNQIMDKNRENFAENIYNELEGLKYSPFECTSQGLAIFEPMDVIQVKDLDDNYYTSVVMFSHLKITTGVQEIIESVIPGAAKEKYAVITDNQRRQSRTEIIVDKQNNIITSIIETQEGLSTQITQTDSTIQQEIIDRKTEDGRIIEETSLLIASTKDEFLIEFTRIDGDIETLGEDLSGLKVFYRFNENGALIGRNDSPLELALNNEQISFIESGRAIAYINGQKMYIKSLEVLEEIILGQHVWETLDYGRSIIRLRGA